MISEKQEDAALKVTPQTSHWLDMYVFSGGRVLFSLKRGEDMMEEFAKTLQEYGVTCHQEFKSPCG